MILWVSGITLLDYFLISFLASESLKDIKQGNQSFQQILLTTHSILLFPQLPHPYIRNFLPGADKYSSLLLPFKMGTIDTSHTNSLKTLCLRVSSNSNNRWPKTASQSQKKSSQACTVVVYSGGGSRHSGALMENNARAIWPLTCHRPVMGGFGFTDTSVNYNASL